MDKRCQEKRLTVIELVQAAKVHGAFPEPDPQPDDRTICYQIEAPVGKQWKVGPKTLRVEWRRGGSCNGAISDAISDMAQGLVDEVGE